MQEVIVSESVKLLDSPGIIASPTNLQVSLALRGLAVEEGKESVLEAVGCLLMQCDQTLVRRISITRNTGLSFIFFLNEVFVFLPRLRSSITSLTFGTTWSF